MACLSCDAGAPALSSTSCVTSCPRTAPPSEAVGEQPVRPPRSTTSISSCSSQPPGTPAAAVQAGAVQAGADHGRGGQAHRGAACNPGETHPLPALPLAACDERRRGGGVPDGADDPNGDDDANSADDAKAVGLGADATAVCLGATAFTAATIDVELSSLVITAVGLATLCGGSARERGSVRGAPPGGMPVAPLRSVELDERVLAFLRVLTSRVLASRVVAGREMSSGGGRSGALSALWPSDLRSSP